MRSTFFLVGPTGTVHVPPNLVKHRFLGKFGFHSIIHTFKNYFTIVFSTISFSFQQISSIQTHLKRPFQLKFYYQKFEEVEKKKISLFIYNYFSHNLSFFFK